MDILKEKIKYLKETSDDYWKRSKNIENPNRLYHSGYADALLLAADELECILREMEVNKCYMNSKKKN